MNHRPASPSIQSHPACAIVICIMLCTVLAPARSETLVSGEAAALTVEAHDAALQEVFAALGTSFGLQVTIPQAVDRSISGTYAGSLPEIIPRLLDGFDFFTRQIGDHLEVVIFGASARAPVIAPVVRRAADDQHF
ncbi:MAG: hypothetical protein QOG83_3715 [Alphaproteobacteria bacterium]|nr:hypothetical protein [Alphaproteobacteria bacterium]